MRSPYFTVDTVDAPWQGDCDEESFSSILILDGEGRISCGEEEMDCRKGDSMFLPACSGVYRLEGGMKALITRVGTI